MKVNTLLRNFKESDYLQVIQLWQETGLTNTERNDTLESIMRTLKMGAALYILEHIPSKNIIGSSWITNDGRRLYLHHFGIKPAFQGLKLSNLHMQASLDFAKNKKMQIKLEVHEQNKIAIDIYEKASFSYLGDFKIFINRTYDKH